jgi:hypothetical protein
MHHYSNSKTIQNKLRSCHGVNTKSENVTVKKSLTLSAARKGKVGLYQHLSGPIGHLYNDPLFTV